MCSMQILGRSIQGRDFAPPVSIAQCLMLPCVWGETLACHVIPVLVWRHSVWARWWCESHLQSCGVLKSRGHPCHLQHPCFLLTHHTSPPLQCLTPNPSGSLGPAFIPSWGTVLVAPPLLLSCKVTTASGPHECTHLHFRGPLHNKELRNLM